MSRTSNELTHMQMSSRGGTAKASKTSPEDRIKHAKKGMDKIREQAREEERIRITMIILSHISDQKLRGYEHKTILDSLGNQYALVSLLSP